jgi:hypothetical protein
MRLYRPFEERKSFAKTISLSDHHRKNEHTGIPPEHEIPAPVTTSIFSQLATTRDK